MASGPGTGAPPANLPPNQKFNFTAPNRWNLDNITHETDFALKCEEFADRLDRNQNASDDWKNGWTQKEVESFRDLLRDTTNPRYLDLAWPAFGGFFDRAPLPANRQNNQAFIFLKKELSFLMPPSIVQPYVVQQQQIGALVLQRIGHAITGGNVGLLEDHKAMLNAIMQYQLSGGDPAQVDAVQQLLDQQHLSGPGPAVSNAPVSPVTAVRGSSRSVSGGSAHSAGTGTPARGGAEQGSLSDLRGTRQRQSSSLAEPNPRPPTRTASRMSTASGSGSLPKSQSMPTGLDQSERPRRPTTSDSRPPTAFRMSRGSSIGQQPSGSQSPSAASQGSMALPPTSPQVPARMPSRGSVSAQQQSSRAPSRGQTPAPPSSRAPSRASTSAQQQPVHAQSGGQTPAPQSSRGQTPAPQSSRAPSRGAASGQQQSFGGPSRGPTPAPPALFAPAPQRPFSQITTQTASEARDNISRPGLPNAPYVQGTYAAGPQQPTGGPHIMDPSFMSNTPFRGITSNFPAGPPAMPTYDPAVGPQTYQPSFDTNTPYYPQPPWTGGPGGYGPQAFTPAPGYAGYHAQSFMPQQAATPQPFAGYGAQSFVPQQPATPQPQGSSYHSVQGTMPGNIQTHPQAFQNQPQGQGQGQGQAQGQDPASTGGGDGGRSRRPSIFKNRPSWAPKSGDNYP